MRSKHKLLTTIAWKIGDEPVEYALEGAVFITGAGVQWLRDGLGIIESAAETEELAQLAASPTTASTSCRRWSVSARRTGIPTRAAP